MRTFFRRFWPDIFILLCGLAVAIIKIDIASDVHYIGRVDEAAYADIAESLISGRGFNVNYISFHFIKYGGLPRPEDHWPPLYSILIAPFFLLMGVTVLAAKMPTILLSSLLLPWILYRITLTISGSRYAALGAGITGLVWLDNFRWSLHCTADLVFSVLLLLAAWFFILGLQRPRYLIAMGLTAGIAYYDKGLILPLLPVFPFCFIVARRSLRAAFDRHLWAGMLAVLLVMAPWLIRNEICYGDPLHSTQTYWMGAMGFGPDDPYEIYWDADAKPGFADRLSVGTTVFLRDVWNYVKQSMYWVWVDMKMDFPNRYRGDPELSMHYLISLGPLRQLFHEFPTYPQGVPIGWFGLPGLLGLALLSSRRRTLVLFALPVALIVFLSCAWQPDKRYLIVTIPMVITLGWTGYSAFIAGLAKKVTRSSISSARLQTGMLTVLIAVFTSFSVSANTHIRQLAMEKSLAPYADGRDVQQRIQNANWLRENLPYEAVIMDRRPWDINFITKHCAVRIPSGSPDDVMRVARHYGVTHLTDMDIHPAYRATIRQLLTNEPPVIELMAELPSMHVYRFLNIQPDADSVR